MLLSGQLNASEIGWLHEAHHAADQHTAEHQSVVAKLTNHLAQLAGKRPEDAKTMSQAARLHDIGKIIIPPRILHKNGPLTDQERLIVERHPIAGAEILKMTGNPSLKLAAQIALEHHENADGSGYPYGLGNKDISDAARIVAICDVYEALRAPRSYKPGLSHDAVIAIMTEGDNRMTPDIFDEAYLRAFIDHHESFEDLYRELQNNTAVSGLKPANA